MARGEALRELQSRLAVRMEVARTQERTRSWLAVECLGRGLLLPLHQAGEIFPVVPWLPVPHTQPWFLGVANLRGGLHGVIDIGEFVGAQSRPTMRENARLVAFGASLHVNAALLVDRLAGLRNMAQLTLEPPSTQAVPSFASARWRDERGRLWQEIDLAALSADDRFLRISD